MASNIKLFSLNVRGLRDNTKRKQMFHWLKHFHGGDKAYIFLQETHSVSSDEKKWQLDWGSKILFDHGSSKSSGVAILFPIGCDNDKFNMVSCNNNGRKLGIEIFPEDDTKSIILLNIYAPTQDKVQHQSEFINSLRKELLKYSDKLISGGDFDLYLDPT